MGLDLWEIMIIKEWSFPLETKWHLQIIPRLEGRSSKNGGIFLDISQVKKLILDKLPRIYEQFLNLQNIDISKEPMEVAPTAHYSMGGIRVSPREHKTKINGLFVAGEAAGGLHGANRLGGIH